MSVIYQACIGILITLAVSAVAYLAVKGGQPVPPCGHLHDLDTPLSAEIPPASELIIAVVYERDQDDRRRPRQLR